MCSFVSSVIEILGPSLAEVASIKVTVTDWGVRRSVELQRLLVYDANYLF